MGKVFFIILAVFLLFGAFSSPILDGIKGWRTEDVSENHVSVTTAAGVETANITLDRDLFQDNASEVISITSNITGEEPLATSYTASSNRLLVSALNEDDTRTLVVNYLADSESSVMAAIGPFLGVLIIGGLVVAIFAGAFGKR